MPQIGRRSRKGDRPKNVVSRRTGVRYLRLRSAISERLRPGKCLR